MTAPQAILKGIDDKSITQPVYDDPVLSQHTPLFLLMTKRGPVNPMFLGYDGFDIYYSLQSLGENSPWHTHQSELVRIAAEVGNSTIMVKRIVDEFSKTADMVVGFNPQNSAVIRTDSFKLEASPLNPNQFVAFLEIQAADPGEWGNRIGVEIFAADEIVQQTMGVSLDAFVYELALVEELEDGTKRNIPNLYGSPTTYFTMKRNSIYNNVDYYFDEIMQMSYIEKITELTRPAYFSNFTLYPESLIGFFDDPDLVRNNVLETFIGSPGMSFGKGRPLYMSGGDDGITYNGNSSLEKRLDRQRRYEEACRNWFETIDDSSEILDILKYPFSTIWDTGFTKETKTSMLNLFSRRKDIWLALAVHSNHRYVDQGDELPTIFDYQPKLDTQSIISLGMQYKSMAQMIGESIDYGTPTVRCTIMMQDGINKNNRYKKRQTLNYDFFRKCAAYFGAGTGKWRTSYAFDSKEGKLLKGWEDVSVSYMSPATKELAWDAGLIWVQNFDTDNMAYMGYHTIYPDDTSVLNSVFVMMACCTIEKIHARAWARVCGDESLTNEELADKVDRYISDETVGIFDDRFIIEPVTTIVGGDAINGFSFTTETNIYATNAKRVGVYNINAHRMSAYTNN